MKQGLKGLFPFFVVVILSSMLAACGLGSAESGRKPSPDWSRGVALSTDVGGTIGMVVARGGDSVYFAWPTAGDDQAHIHYQQLNGKAEAVVDRDLDLPPGRQRTPRLLLAGEGRLHLFWAIRQENSRDWILWYAQLDDTGQVVGSASQVSPAGMNVGDFTIVQNVTGEAYIVFRDRTGEGFYAAPVSDQGLTGDFVQLTSGGESPGARLDDEGTLHLAWFDDLTLRYAAFKEGELTLDDGIEIYKMAEIAAELDGPTIGVAGDWVYLIWSTYARSGLESNTGWTEYVAFPRGEPAPTDPSRIWIMPMEEQPYEDYRGDYPLTVLVPPPPSPALSAEYILEPDTAAGRGNEVAAVVAVNQQYRLDDYIQMATILFRDSEYLGYQMSAKTQSFSQEGLLSADSEGNLHQAWREGTGRKLYYASTAPGMKAGLDNLGSTDLLNAFLGGGMEAAVGALFFPLALVWFIPGALLLGIWKLRKDDETINNTTSRLFLVVAILLYQGTKILFLPSILSYVPFSAWLDVPQGLGLILQLIIPILLFGAGFLVAEWIRRRQPEMSTLLYFFVVCGVDAILTLMVYGVNYLGVL